MDDLRNSSERVIACADKQIEISLFYSVSLGPAVLIVVILAFHRTRKFFSPECCGGRPGVPVPLNLLDEFEHRWAYAVAFGAITNTIIGIMTGFEGSVSSEGVQPAFKVLFSFWRALETCVNFFPFFACLYTENVLLGAILGTAYSSMWFAIKLLSLIDCANPVPEILPYLTVASQWPTIVCLLFLMIKFIWYAILYLRGAHEGDTMQRIEESVVFPFQIAYVKALLRKPPPSVDWKSKEQSILQKIAIYYKKYYYDSRHDFRFSTRIICTVMVIFMCNYQMGIVQLYFSEAARRGLKEIATSLINASNLIPQNSTRTYQENINSALILLQVSWVISTGLAFLVFGVGTIGTISNYRTNLLSLFRGDRSFYPPRYKVQTDVYVANSMKYSGFQIAYAIWGNLIMVFVLLVITLLISFVFILPIINGNWTTTNFLIQAIILPFCISMGMRLVQLLLAKYFFLQPKHVQKDEDHPLAINNRRWYHVANYFFFIANVAVGLFSSLTRILKGVAIGLFYMGKLDRCVLMSGWEGSDAGFTAYIGMLEVEHAHNHPVMRVFCDLLTKRYDKPGACRVCEDRVGPRGGHATATQRPHGPSGSENSPQEGLSSEFGTWCNEPTKDKRMDDSSPTSSVPQAWQPQSGTRGRAGRGRWLLLYTLLRNPQLVGARRQGPAGGATLAHPLPTGGSTTYHQLKALVAALEMRAQSQGPGGTISDPITTIDMIETRRFGEESPGPLYAVTGVPTDINEGLMDGRYDCPDASKEEMGDDVLSSLHYDPKKYPVKRLYNSNKVHDVDQYNIMKEPTSTVQENTSF